MNKQIEIAIEQQVNANLLARKLDSSLSVHGLSFTEYQIMAQLVQAKPYGLSRVALAKTVALTASGITRLLLPMEKSGLITKTSNPRDARQSLVLLSEAGSVIFEQASVAVQHSCEDLFSLLTEQQTDSLRQLSRLLRY